MNIRPLLIPIAVLGAFGGAVAWLVLTDPPSPQESSTKQSARPHQTAKASEEPQKPRETGEPSPNARVSAELPPGDIRDVSPEGVSAPEITGKLTRIEPSERFLELMNPPVEPMPDGPLDLIHVEVLDGGHLKSGQLTVKLVHIDPLPLEATCKTELGASWPCGTRARTFLRGLIRRFKVSCSKEEDLGPQKIIAACHRGKIDLSKQLVRFGWASASKDAPDELQALAATAQAEKRGQWQTDWTTEIPENDWVGQSTLDQLDLEELAPDAVDWSLRTDPNDLSWPGSAGNPDTSE